MIAGRRTYIDLGSPCRSGLDHRSNRASRRSRRRDRDRNSGKAIAATDDRSVARRRGTCSAGLRSPRSVDPAAARRRSTPAVARLSVGDGVRAGPAAVQAQTAVRRRRWPPADIALTAYSRPERLDRDRRQPSAVAASLVDSGPQAAHREAAQEGHVIDRTATTHTPDGAAQRRVFHSKVDTIRPTYGFEDVSLAPGTDTIEPADVDLAQTFAGIDLAIPIIASAMDAVVDPRVAGELARLGGLAILNLEGVQTRYDEPDAILERIASAPADEVQAILAEVYAQPIREDLIVGPAPGHPRRRLEGGRRRHTGCRPPLRPVLRRARRRPVPRPEPGLERPPPRHRVRPALARRVHPLHADPGRGRQHDQRRGGLRADGAGRGGGLRRRRAGCRVHDPRGPRHRRPAGHRDQRRGRGPRRLLRRDRPVRPGRRRRRHAPRRRAGQGDRRRRRRR